MVSLNERRKAVDEQRRIRMAAAITVNLILLIAILTAVIIYQLITIGLGSGQKKALEKEINEYEQKIAQEEKNLEYLKSEQFLVDYLFQHGYTFSSSPKD